MNSYMIVWGSAVKEVREGHGENEVVAARYAFGHYDERTMTFKSIKRSELKIDARRTRVCFDLLTYHAERMSLQGSKVSAEKAIEQAVELRKQWHTRWARLKESA